METLLVFALLAWLLMRWFDLRSADFLRERQKILEQRLMQQPVKLSVEQMGDTLYCWDIVSNDFVCQGRDIQELRKNFALRYPDRNAAIAQAPEELVSQLKTQLQNLKQNENLSSQ